MEVPGSVGYGTKRSLTTDLDVSSSVECGPRVIPATNMGVPGSVGYGTKMSSDMNTDCNGTTHVTEQKWPEYIVENETPDSSINPHKRNASDDDIQIPRKSSRMRDNDFMVKKYKDFVMSAKYISEPPKSFKEIGLLRWMRN